MEIPVNKKPSDSGRGGPPRHHWAQLRKTLLTGLLVLAALVGFGEFTYRFGWSWFILLALVWVLWFALGAYSDHLVRQGRYDQALRVTPLLAIGDAGRSRLRADVLTDAGRYGEAERILREIIDHRRVTKFSKATKVKTFFDLGNLGNVLMETDRLEEAQQCFRSAAGMYPYHSTWATGLAEALLRQGIFPERALEHAERALKLFRRGAERFSNRSRLGAILATKAWALAACDRGVEAHEAIDAAQKSPARKTKGTLAQVHYKSGMSLLALSDNRGAEEHFAQGVKLDPAGRWGRLCAEALRRQRQVTQACS
jgi:tetratricopeptide (TPR) repeat protein